MQVLIAPDKFKGSLTGEEVAAAMAAGVRAYDARVAVTQHPLADGGEGTLEALRQVLPTETVTVEVSDPLFRPLAATYLRAGTTAFIEMAAASGLPLLQESERSATATTTLGTGELIRHALAQGATKIYLMIGGSATNDLGIGMAHALGYRFLSKDGNELSPIGAHMVETSRIDASHVMDLSAVAVTVICDVQNPLYGPKGAAYVYARQKGASDQEVASLDEGLRHLSAVILRDLDVDVSELPGAGAAGGIGGGAVAFLGATLQPGIEAVMEMTHFEDKVRAADLIITGEGKLDEQTLQGKVIDGVRRLAGKHQKPFGVVCGVCELTEDQLADLGAVGVLTLKSDQNTVQEAIARAGEIVRERSGTLIAHFMRSSG